MVEIIDIEDDGVEIIDVEDDGEETPVLEKSISKTEMSQRSIKLPDAVVRDIIEKKGPEEVIMAIKDKDAFKLETFLGDSGVKTIIYRASATSYIRAAYQTKSEFWGDLVSNLSIERNTPLLFSWDRVKKGFMIKLKNPISIPIPASLPLPVQPIASKGALGVGVDAGKSVMVIDVVASFIEACLLKGNAPSSMRGSLITLVDARFPLTENDRVHPRFPTLPFKLPIRRSALLPPPRVLALCDQPAILDQSETQGIFRSTLMERMPVLDEATYNGRKGGSIPSSALSSNGLSANLPNGVPKAAPTAPLVDLLDLSSDDVPAATSSGGDFLQDLLGDLAPALPQSGSSQNQKSGTDALLDLLSIGSSPAANTSATPDILSLTLESNNSGFTPKQVSSLSGTTPMVDLLDGLSSSQPTIESNGSQFPSLVAFENDSLKMTFDFAKDSANLQTTSIKATFVNLSETIYTDFIFQAAVPKFLQLHLDPASSTTLPAIGNGSVTQSLRVTNSQHGKKRLVMRLRIGYKVNGKDVLVEDQISNFPPNL